MIASLLWLRDCMFIGVIVNVRVARLQVRKGCKIASA